MAKQLRKFDFFREDMVRSFSQSCVQETVGGVVPRVVAEPDERLAQCIWFDGMFLYEGLKTDSGKSLEIVHPGRWNHEAGPDFMDAKIRVNGVLKHGDIEIHLCPESWKRHNHHIDSNYDSVVLHACLWPARQEFYDTRNSLGERIEGFCMERVLFPDLETIRQTVRVEDFPYQMPERSGRCRPLMCSLEADYVTDMMEAAGRERIEAKVRRAEAQSLGLSLDQVFYQSLMMSMGHKANKGLFFLLSKRTPVGEMVDYLRDVEAVTALSAAETSLFFQSIFLHVAQLMPQDDGKSEFMDEETSAYLDCVQGHWGRFSEFYSDRIIPRARQWNSGVRPVNFSQRRLAGVAHLLVRWFLKRDIGAVFAPIIRSFDSNLPVRKKTLWIRDSLVKCFVVEDPEDFWTHRYTFTSKRSARGMKLIGESRAASVVFNALLPLVLCHARRAYDVELEEKTWEVLGAFPALESNAIVRHMRARLFGEDERAKSLLSGELRSQGLFHIFAECCNHNEKTCEDCYYSQAQTA